MKPENRDTNQRAGAPSCLNTQMSLRLSGVNRLKAISLQNGLPRFHLLPVDEQPGFVSLLHYEFNPQLKENCAQKRNFFNHYFFLDNLDE